MNYLKRNFIAIGAMVLMLFGILIQIVPTTPSPKEVLLLMGSFFVFTSWLLFFLADKVSRMEK